MRKLTVMIAAVAALVLGVVGIASAAVIFDAETGEGFVGKGDVQTALGYNNHQLQANAELLKFRAASEETTTWNCVHVNDPANDQQRSTTTTISGLVSHTERVRNQITGFGLDGYDGDPVVIPGEQEVGNCPNPNRNFDPDSVQTEGGDSVVQVSGDGGATWKDL